MPDTEALPAPSPRRRPHAGAVVLVVLTAVLAFLVVTVSYGLSREYGDTTVGDARVAAWSLRVWGVGLLLVLGCAAWAGVAARRARGRRALTVAALVLAVASLVGVPAGAVVGVHQKYDAYPEVPRCTVGFRDGPAVPVVRAAQTGFTGIEHPGPFSGGGSSGVDGCSSQLMVGEDVDVPAAYRDALTAAGWRVHDDHGDRVTATRDGQDFEATLDQEGAWWVWIGPSGLRPQPTRPGEVAPRS